MTSRHALTPSNVLDLTSYGADIYCHILRKYYPDEIVMHTRGADHGLCPNPWDGGRHTLRVWDEILDPGAKLPSRRTRHHDHSGHIPDGTALDFAAFFYQQTGDILLQTLNSEMHLRLGKLAPGGSDWLTWSNIPRFSYFRAPVSRTAPDAEWTLHEAWLYITGNAARTRTDHLRALTAEDQQARFKRTRLDFCTFSGLFRTRSTTGLIHHSGLLCIDFDHLADVEGLFGALLTDKYFRTELLFRSPRGHGLKWIIPIDPTERTHEDWFRAIEAYILQTYRVPIDASGKDVSRACFLPHDPQAWLHPRYHKFL